MMPELGPQEVPIEAYFQEVYDKNGWGCGSGVGSLASNTLVYRKILEAVLKDHHIHSVLDVGCGDWQIGKLIDWTGYQYIGIDIVPTVVETLKATYVRDNVHFICANALEEYLPQADILILKDVIQHWKPDEIRYMIPRLSKYELLLVTNDSKIIQGTAIERWHTIDLADYELSGEVLLTEQVQHTIKTTTLIRRT